MAPLAAADFELAIKLLDKVASAASSTSSSNGKAAAAHDLQQAFKLNLLLQCGRHTSMARAALSQMLKKKIPYRLAAGCCTVLGSCAGPASSAGSTPGPWVQSWTSPGQSLALSSLAALLSSTAAARSSQAAAFAQQLQQSGILKLLPQLLDAAADWLQEAASSSPQDSHSSSGSSSSSSTSGSSNGSSPVSSTPTDSMGQITTRITCLLDMYGKLASCWPVGAFHAEAAPGCALPALRCAWRAHQHLSSHLQHSIEQRSGPPAEGLVALGLRAEFAAMDVFRVVVVEAESACSKRSMQQFRSALMSSEALLPCLAISIATHTFSLLLDSLGQLPPAANPAGGTGSTAAATGGCSASSNIRSSSNGSVPNSDGSKQPSGVPARLTAEMAWQLACRQRQHVPPTHQRLLGLLGCDPTAVLALAAMSLRHWQDGADHADVCLRGALVAYSQMADAAEDLPREETFRVCGWQAELHLLIPAVLLHWLAHHPGAAASPGSELLLACGMAWVTSSVPLACQVSATGVPEVPASRFQAVLVEVLPWVLRLGSYLQQTMGLPSASGSTSSSAITATSSMRSGGGSSSRSSPASLQRSATPCLSESETDSAPHQRIAMSAVQLMSLVTILVSHTDSGWTGVNLGLGDAVQIGRLLEASARACPTLPNIPICLLELAGKQGVLFQAATQAGTHLDGSSREQRQLAGLWLSALKAVHVASHSQPVRAVCFEAAAVACGMLQVLLDRGPDQQGTWPVTEAIPWLVLLGRSLVLVTWAATHLNSTAALASSSSADVEAAVPPDTVCCGTRWGPLPVAAAAATPDTEEVSEAEGLAPDRVCVGSLSLRALQAWLRAEGVVQQMSAAGYDAEGLLQLWLQQPDSDDRDMFAEPVSSWMRSLGLALNRLPFPVACNNVACTNLAGQQELQLVNGRSCICAGCRVARYCSRACQRAAWQEHKPVCKALAAAAAAGSRVW